MLRCPKCQSDQVTIVVSNVSLILRQSERGSFTIDRSAIEDNILINNYAYDKSAPILPTNEGGWADEAEFELVNKDADIKEVKVICHGDCEGFEQSVPIRECLSQEERIAKRSW